MTTIITERGVSTVITEVESGKTIVSQPPGPSTVISRSAQPGLQGSQGAQGDEGSQGTIGASGPQGSQGAAGAQGDQGPQGSQGQSGSQGPQGSTGAQGVHGADGSQGAQGSSGSQGAAGVQGPQGADGVGTQGPQGSTGAQGSQGSQGVAGGGGGPGSQGAQGAAGVQGSQGPQGNDGAAGSQGSQGSQGAQGVHGVDGSQGPQGTSGSQGSAGAQGSQGSTGSQGATGAQGATGTQGTQGVTGSQGATGAQGNQGFQGATGAQGSTGAQGNQGVQGAQGSQGSQGAQGNQGNQGTPGYPTNFTTKTANYTAASNDYVLCNAAGGLFTVTLPSNPAVGTRVAAKKIDSSSNLPLVVPSGSGTIDGDASATLASQWAGGVFEHEGSDVWAVVAVSGPQGNQGAQGSAGSPVGYPVASGQWWHVGVGPLSNFAMTLNVMYLFPADMPAAQTWQGRTVDISAGGTTGAVLRGGFYGSDTNGQPDLTNLIADIGTVAATSATLVTWSGLSVALPKGRIWLALVSQVAACTVRGLTTGVPLPFSIPSGGSPVANNALQLLAVTGVSGALPTSGTLTANNNTQPKTWLQAA